ncbi:hypothetical protein O4H61_03475 [Roseovarius aestuarii]|nr:hypothetical protein [Roseovarius aestuarii]
MNIFRRAQTQTNDAYCGIEMGDLVKDTLSGFTGAVIARLEHLTGCNQVHVLPQSDAENEMKDGVWFDIERIELIKKAAVQINTRQGGADIPRPRTSGPAVQL